MLNIFKLTNTEIKFGNGDGEFKFFGQSKPETFNKDLTKDEQSLIDTIKKGEYAPKKEIDKLHDKLKAFYKHTFEDKKRKEEAVNKGATFCQEKQKDIETKRAEM